MPGCVCLPRTAHAHAAAAYCLLPLRACVCFALLCGHVWSIRVRVIYRGELFPWNYNNVISALILLFEVRAVRAVQCSAVRCSACGTVPYGAVRYIAVQCYAMLCGAAQCSAVQYSAVQSGAKQCSAA